MRVKVFKCTRVYKVRARVYVYTSAWAISNKVYDAHAILCTRKFTGAPCHLFFTGNWLFKLLISFEYLENRLGLKMLLLLVG